MPFKAALVNRCICTWHVKLRQLKNTKSFHPTMGFKNTLNVFFDLKKILSKGFFKCLLLKKHFY